MVNIPDVDFSKFDDPSKQDREQCGVIIRVGRRIELVVVRNAHPDPVNHFAIHQRSIDDLMLTPVDEILAYAHTHLEGDRHSPSKADIAWQPKGLLGVVYHPGRGTAVWYTSRGILRNGYRKTKVRTS